MSRAIEVVAIVLADIPNAMHDNNLGGQFQSYDATRLRVLSPAKFIGTELTIFRPGEVPPESPWRAIGRQVSFEIDPSLLNSDTTLFVGAVEHLRLVERT